MFRRPPAAPEGVAGGLQPLSPVCPVLLEQLQGRLRLGVGLRQDRDAGLLQDVVPRQLRGLVGDVDVADARLSGAEVLGLDGEVVDGAAQTVLDGAERTAQATLYSER